MQTEREVTPPASPASPSARWVWRLWRLAALAALLFGLFFGVVAIAQQVTADQGNPGTSGPWPVSISGSTASGLLVFFDGGVVTINPGGTGVPTGTLVSTAAAPVDSGTTATPFSVVANTWYDVQCNAAACVGPTAGCSCTVTSGNYQPVLQANTEKRIKTPPGGTSLCAVAVSGNATCVVMPLSF